MRNVLVTGANGFIGKNLVARLNELSDFLVLPFGRGDDISTLKQSLSEVDCIIHLAGENRPSDPAAYSQVNVGMTRILCDAIRDYFAISGKRKTLILASSIQAEMNTPYGKSKAVAEQLCEELSRDIDIRLFTYRLPGVFGKWCKPEYNSVVATFCNNVANGLPIEVHDPDVALRLVYIDDVISAFINVIRGCEQGYILKKVEPEYTLTVGRLAECINAFDYLRENLVCDTVGSGFMRALYSTYVSYLPTSKFSYSLPRHDDSRGVFVEMLKTKDSGQFSFFTARPGVTRGGHYHHTKTEKFLVVAGEALFRFRHIITNETVEIRTCGDTPKVVDTIPGWAHEITNTGSTELIVMLWANEVFDPVNPDTVPSEV